MESTQSIQSIQSTSTPIFNISTFISSAIGEHLSSWLAEKKGVQVTSEEIVTALGLPYNVKVPMQNMGLAPQMPTIAGLTSVPVTVGKRTGGRKKKDKERIPNPDAPSCIYSLQRGINKGSICGEECDNDPTIKGSDKYCSDCLKKKTVQNTISGTQPTRGGKKTVPQPNIPGRNVQPVSQPQPLTLTVEPYDTERRLYIDRNTGFLIQRNPDGNIIAIGKLENGQERTLRDDEKIMASKMGCATVQSQPTINQSFAPNLTNQVPSTIPSIPSVPQMPMMGNQVSSIPQIPTMSNQIPSMPSINNQIPSMPTMPQPF